jgi:hypothetical protein
MPLLGQVTPAEEMDPLRHLPHAFITRVCKEAERQLGKGFTQNPEFQKYFKELMRRWDFKKD